MDDEGVVIKLVISLISCLLKMSCMYDNNQGHNVT